MLYHEKVLNLLQSFKELRKNAIIDFFTQLSTIRILYMHTIMIAISSDHEDYESCIKAAVQPEDWMMKVSLGDLRNIIVFINLKCENRIIESTKYIGKYDDALFYSFDRSQTVGTKIKELEILLETLFYVRQILIMKYRPSDIDEKFKMFHDHITTQSLQENVYDMYTLLKTIIIF
jgi:hypothetical protein